MDYIYSFKDGYLVDIFTYQKNNDTFDSSIRICFLFSNGMRFVLDTVDDYASIIKLLIKYGYKFDDFDIVNFCDLLVMHLAILDTKQESGDELIYIKDAILTDCDMHLIRWELISRNSQQVAYDVFRTTFAYTFDSTSITYVERCVIGTVDYTQER